MGDLWGEVWGELIWFMDLLFTVLYEGYSGLVGRCVDAWWYNDVKEREGIPDLRPLWGWNTVSYTWVEGAQCSYVLWEILTCSPFLW